MTAIYLELVKGAFTLLAVALGSFVALLLYFRQKEYELTKQRYLEGAVDIVASELDVSFGVVSHNYARCLQICKSFRDVEHNFDKRELERGFLQFDGSKFHQIAHHRISSLLGIDTVWGIFQSAMATAVSANAMMVTEIPETLRILSDQPMGMSDRRKDAERMIRDMQETHDATFKYAVLVRELHVLGILLESTKLSITSVAKFRDREDVRELIARLQSAYPRDDTSNEQAA